MNNDYVVRAYCTSHWVIVIICMKFKEVWYLDSDKTSPAKVPKPKTICGLVSFL
jgi:Ulp1 family protease